MGTGPAADMKGDSALVQKSKSGHNQEVGTFPGGPVVKTLCFHRRGHRSNPWFRNYLISSASVRSILFLSFIMPMFA